MMQKKLSEMSLEELWQLFPIVLTRHQTCWKEWYLEEDIRLKTILPQMKRISHIGSTAIPTIWAKPIIDILVEVPKGSNLSDYKDRMTDHGYICMAQSAERISFNKGYTEDGFADRVFHCHIRYEGDNDELYFRDYLLEHPGAAKKYEKLKRKLWKEYEHDRDGYTNAKSTFVINCTKRAKALYRGRYKKRDFDIL